MLDIVFGRWNHAPDHKAKNQGYRNLEPQIVTQPSFLLKCGSHQQIGRSEAAYYKIQYQAENATPARLASAGISLPD